MEKVFLGVFTGAIDDQAIAAVRAFLDFVYYAQYQSHTDMTLGCMRRAFDGFHSNKAVFIELGARNPKHFNIPKFHSLMHYVESIPLLRCLDGLNTEASERLHIDLAKKAYRASNRRDYIAQMTQWLQRQEALHRRSAYLDWVDNLDLAKRQGRSEDKDDESEGENDGIMDGLVTPEVCALKELIDSNVSHAYQVAKVPAIQQISITELQTKYGASDFVNVLNKFLDTHIPGAAHINNHDHFDLYSAISVLLPHRSHVSNSKRIARIRATPSTERDSRCKATPQHFDTALILENEADYQAHGSVKGKYRNLYCL